VCSTKKSTVRLSRLFSSLTTKHFFHTLLLVSRSLLRAHRSLLCVNTSRKSIV